MHNSSYLWDCKEHNFALDVCKECNPPVLAHKDYNSYYLL